MAGWAFSPATVTWTSLERLAKSNVVGSPVAIGLKTIKEKIGQMEGIVLKISTILVVKMSRNKNQILKCHLLKL